jgi:hypothetical protein
MTPKIAPSATALSVNSAGDADAGTYGLKAPGGETDGTG